MGSTLDLAWRVPARASSAVPGSTAEVWAALSTSGVASAVRTLRMALIPLRPCMTSSKADPTAPPVRAPSMTFLIRPTASGSSSSVARNRVTGLVRPGMASSMEDRFSSWPSNAVKSATAPAMVPWVAAMKNRPVLDAWRALTPRATPATFPTAPATPSPGTNPIPNWVMVSRAPPM